MLKLMMMASLAGLTSLTCLPQTSATTPEKPTSAQLAQGAKNFYQLSFVVREVEGERVINSRSYSMITRTDKQRSSIRAGEKVPFASVTGGTTQWQQINVGVNIDCRELEETGDRLSLYISADISSMMEGQEQNGSTSSTPIIRSNQWDSMVTVPLKQPTILFSSDDPASKRKMQLQLTATLLH